MLEPFWKLVKRIALMMGVHTPPGPYAGLWSWKYLDTVRTARLVMNRRVQATYTAFPDRYPPGSEFPEIELETTDGRTINTRDHLGDRHFVLFTGALT